MTHFTKLTTATMAAAIIVILSSTAQAFPNYTCEYSDEVLEAWDVNGDGVLTQADEECLQELIFAGLAGTPTAVPECLAGSVASVDYNGDRRITIVDHIRLGQAIARYGECALYADINGSGEFNSADPQCMTLSVMAMQQGAPLPGCVWTDEAVDLDCDGEFDLLDFMIFLHVLHGGLNPEIDANGNDIHDACE